MIPEVFRPGRKHCLVVLMTELPDLDLLAVGGLQSFAGVDEPFNMFRCPTHSRRVLSFQRGDCGTSVLFWGPQSGRDRWRSDFWGLSVPFEWGPSAGTGLPQSVLCRLIMFAPNYGFYRKNRPRKQRKIHDFCPSGTFGDRAVAAKCVSFGVRFRSATLRLCPEPAERDMASASLGMTKGMRQGGRLSAGAHGGDWHVIRTTLHATHLRFYASTLQRPTWATSDEGRATKPRRGACGRRGVGAI